MYRQNCDANGHPSLCRFFINPDANYRPKSPTHRSGNEGRDGDGGGGGSTDKHRELESSTRRSYIFNDGLWSSISASDNLELCLLLKIKEANKCELDVQMKVHYGLSEKQEKFIFPRDFSTDFKLCTRLQSLGFKYQPSPEDEFLCRLCFENLFQYGILNSPWQTIAKAFGPLPEKAIPTSSTLPSPASLIKNDFTPPPSAFDYSYPNKESRHVDVECSREQYMAAAETEIAPMVWSSIETVETPRGQEPTSVDPIHNDEETQLPNEHLHVCKTQAVSPTVPKTHSNLSVQGSTELVIVRVSSDECAGNRRILVNEDEGNLYNNCYGYEGRKRLLVEEEESMPEETDAPDYYPIVGLEEAALAEDNANKLYAYGNGSSRILMTADLDSMVDVDMGKEFFLAKTESFDELLPTSYRICN